MRPLPPPALSPIPCSKLPGVRDIDGGLQGVAVLLMKRSGKFASVVDGSVERQVSGAVTQGEVALRELGLGCVKRHLVARHPAFIAVKIGLYIIPCIGLLFRMTAT